ncbi:MAG TPA: GDP-mannose 4,6-dehydratase [Gemmatimonadaceae bacterium]|nr:GDP-mannose 4,6-dehydratase [Gemmatimonadaceae bacterium]
MRALVTGGGGFVGQWLSKLLLARGASVDCAGLGRVPSLAFGEDEARRIRWMNLDLRSVEDVDAVVEASRPDVIFHLAGVSFPPDAERAPLDTFEVNTLGVVRLLAAVRRRRDAGTIDPVVVVVGSGMQYGAHAADEMPLGEGAEQRPVTIYAASKSAQETAALQVFRASGVRVICTRSFNHSGPGQPGHYLLPSLVARVRAVLAGESRELTLGNNVVRDYLHVSDVVRAYVLLAERGTPGEVYNVASGRGVSAHDLARDVLLRAGASADITTSPTLVRTSDVPINIGSPEKLSRDTGWEPLKTHLEIIDDLLHAATD